jgi:hypothetical protein
VVVDPPRKSGPESPPMSWANPTGDSKSMGSVMPRIGLVRCSGGEGLPRSGRAGQIAKPLSQERPRPGNSVWPGRTQVFAPASTSSVSSATPLQASHLDLPAWTGPHPVTALNVDMKRRRAHLTEVEANHPSELLCMQALGAGCRGPDLRGRSFGTKESLGGGAVRRSPGGVEPRGTDPVIIRGLGRSQKARLSTGLRREIRCHSDGLRW